jgi:hypothetical protein
MLVVDGLEREELGEEERREEALFFHFLLLLVRLVRVEGRMISTGERAP